MQISLLGNIIVEYIKHLKGFLLLCKNSQP